MKIAVLGYGSIGARHGANIESLGHTFAGYDPSISGYGDRDKIINWSDAIVVASPSKQHANDFLDAVNAGKHVLVEKPFGYDCPPYMEGLVKGARMKDPKLIIATGFNLRFHDCVKKAKEMMPELGDIQCACFTVNQKTTKPPYLMDGILRNWCSHEIDLAHYLLGDLEVEGAVAPADDAGRDTIEAWITLKSPAIKTHCFIRADYYTDPEQRFFWIEGTKGAIYVNLVRRECYFRLHGQSPHLIFQAGDSWDQNYLEEMKTFINSIEDRWHLHPLATGEDGCRALYTVMAARAKAGLGD